MNARSKLNVAVISACLIASGLLGLMLESWLAFGCALVITTAAAHDATGIRLGPSPTRHEGGPRRRG